MAVTPSGGEHSSEAAARIARWYRLASTEEPPRHVDSAIAAAARRPVEPVRHRRAVPWWNLWRLPFAVVAVAVISVSLVTLMTEEGGERLTSVPLAAAPEVAERDLGQAPAAKVESQAPEHRARAAEPLQSRTDALTPDPKAATARAGSLRREAAPHQEAQLSAAEPGPGALQKAAPPQAVQSKIVAPATVAQDRASAPAAAVTPMPNAQSAVSDGRAASTPAARVAPQGATGARALEGERITESAPRLSSDVAVHIVQLEGRVPSLWIERIVALRRDGRRAEADGLLAEFKRRFPDEALPASLQ